MTTKLFLLPIWHGNCLLGKLDVVAFLSDAVSFPNLPFLKALFSLQALREDGSLD